MPVWHASVAFQGRSGPVRFDDLNDKKVRKGVRIASRLLKGVGGKRMAFTSDPPECAIHVQKPLTEEEIAMLPEGWMEIPATDERGPCKMLRQGESNGE